MEKLRDRGREKEVIIEKHLAKILALEKQMEAERRGKSNYAALQADQ